MYEVQMYTICDGWVNCWTVSDENGEEKETFPTEKEANAAIDEFFKDIEDEVKAGNRQEDEGYDREDFRVEKIKE